MRSDSGEKRSSYPSGAECAKEGKKEETESDISPPCRYLQSSARKRWQRNARTGLVWEGSRRKVFRAAGGSRRSVVPVNFRIRGTMGLRKLKNIKHKGKSVEAILKAHTQFFAGKEGGERANLEGADLSRADLTKANLAGAILRHANLEQSDLRGARLPGADLSGAKLRKADLRNTDMTEAVLPGADLEEAQASGVEFFRCDLSNTNFQKALLRNANFRNAVVDGAKFSGADMGITILRETDLSKADLRGVDLSTTLLPVGYAAK